ncbi:helix-turn-helix transcriptional regulator [Marinobacter xestospongiae]|uniref:AraC family transcriptional regulator n=1 Tax=Marinobacter xestospongiae TaxID=994319 RepID=A0ABU3VWJ2_9GAMM|nr:AraC family transcriptional regulator [Marinobacter xestospongiae]MDV2078556.1 AraC family transcriptional regulator [Marinobacter xestospongiae]
MPLTERPSQAPDTTTDRASEILSKRVVLAEMVERDQRQKIVARNLPYGRVLATGRFLSETTPSGLGIQAGYSEEQADAHVVATIQPCLTLTVLLCGEVHFGYDSEEFVLRAPRGGRQLGQQALAVNLRRLTTFRREIRRSEQPLGKVHIQAGPDWFLRGKGDSDMRQRLSNRLLGRHLARHYWQPSRRVLTLCEQILALREEGDALHRNLQVESLALQVMGHFIEDVLRAPDGTDTATAQPPSRRGEPLAAALAFIEAHLHRELRLEEIARASAMSVSTLQRRFKQETGITVFDYIRNRRLDKVRDGLRMDRLSISEAAYMAGYNHPSNFITAFKRRFGVTPGNMNDNNSRSL